MPNDKPTKDERVFKKVERVFKKYDDDIKLFGFDKYDIDFSYMSDEKIEYICEAMRAYNKAHPNES